MSVRMTMLSKVMSDVASYARRRALPGDEAIAVTARTRPPAVTKRPSLVREVPA